jgi:hypothetical protein
MPKLKGKDSAVVLALNLQELRAVPDTREDKNSLTSSRLSFLTRGNPLQDHTQQAMEISTNPGNNNTGQAAQSSSTDSQKSSISLEGQEALVTQDQSLKMKGTQAVQMAPVARIGIPAAVETVMGMEMDLAQAMEADLDQLVLGVVMALAMEADLGQLVLEMVMALAVEEEQGPLVALEVSEELVVLGEWVVLVEWVVLGELVLTDQMDLIQLVHPVLKARTNLVVLAQDTTLHMTDPGTTLPMMALGTTPQMMAQGMIPQRTVQGTTQEAMVGPLLGTTYQGTEVTLLATLDRAVPTAADLLRALAVQSTWALLAPQGNKVVTLTMAVIATLRLAPTQGQVSTPDPSLAKSPQSGQEAAEGWSSPRTTPMPTTSAFKRRRWLPSWPAGHLNAMALAATAASTILWARRCASGPASSATQPTATSFMSAIGIGG